jgi:hypothetical protein
METRKRAAGLEGRARDIAGLLCAESYGGELTRALWLPGVSHINEIFTPDSDEYRALEALIGEDDARLAHEMWNACVNHPYQENPRISRSYRSIRHSAAYIHRVVYILQAFMLACADGFSVERYLDGRAAGDFPHAFPFEHRFVSNAIASSLDRRDERSDAILSRISEMVSVGARRGELNGAIVSGLLKSTRDDAIDIVLGLIRSSDIGDEARLFAAEKMDSGSRQAFVGILKLMMEEELPEYARVAEAFFSCAGIGLIAAGMSDRARMLIESAYKCVTDDDYRAGALGSPNPVDAVVALWSLSWHGIEFAEAAARNILSKDAPRHKKLASLYFTSRLGLDGVQYEIARQCLDDPDIAGDMEMMAWVMSSLGGDGNSPLKFITIGAGARSPYIRFVDHGVVRLTEDERAGYGVSLQGRADAFPPEKESFTFADSVAPGINAEYSRSGVIAVMLNVSPEGLAPSPDASEKDRDDSPCPTLPDVPETLDFPALIGMGLDADGMAGYVRDLYSAMNDALTENISLRYTVSDGFGNESEAALGEGVSILPYEPPSPGERSTLDDYPLAEKWREILGSLDASGAFLFFVSHIGAFSDNARRAELFEAMPGGGPAADFARCVCQIQQPLSGRFGYAGKITELIRAMTAEFPADELYRPLRGFALWALRNRGLFGTCAKSLRRTMYFELMESLIGLMRVISSRASDEIFADFFMIIYAWSRESEEARKYVPARDAARAYSLGLLERDDMIRFVTMIAARSGLMRSFDRFGLSGDYDELRKIAPGFFDDVINPVAQRAADAAKNPGDRETEYRAIAATLRYIPGTRHFADILERSGKEPFDRRVRGDGYLAKMSMPSHLLYRSYPADGEDAGTLREMMAGRNISDQRLLDGAMFAPQWTGIVSGYLGWDGLASAMSFFQAHANDIRTADREAAAARHSSITIHGMDAGAVDAAWFEDIYEALGDERFDMLLEASKNISGSSRHRRFMLLTDALRGRVTPEDAKRGAAEGRSAIHALCLSLIPLNKANLASDSLRRYDLLRKFSRVRRNAAAHLETAVSNLAVGAGYSDAARFVWAMEGEKFRSLEEYMTPRAVGDVEAHIEISASGLPALVVRRDGKSLRGMPGALKKDPYAEELAAAANMARGIRDRAASALERAMERESEFGAEELRMLSANPVIGPIIKHLVFAAVGEDDRVFGFPGELPDAGAFVIAHPFHMYRARVWDDYRHKLSEEGISQPFDQVFRELHMPTDDEIESSVSRKREGGRVRLATSAALMRARGWTADGRAGLRYVFRRENIVSAIASPGNWFAPTDADASIIGGVSFATLEGAPVPIRSVPEVIFSEVMRDVDMMAGVL